MTAERVLAGRYRLRDELGRGGMGVVWRAYDERLAREVAVKEVRAPDVLSERDVRHLHARLEREAWAAGRIAHRNVVTVYDVVSEGGRPWIVMELVRGLSYDQVLTAEGPQPPQRAAAVAAEVLAALRAAHSAGVLHRDVKPPNVLIGNDGRTVLTDFGIAVVEGSTHLTLTGQLVGSPEYLAPERALGRAPGPASDLWSLGVMLYAAVEGTVPFRYDSVLSTMRAIVEELPRRPRHAGPLTPVIEGLLRKDPEERPAAGEVARMLAIVAEGGDPREPEAAFRQQAAAPPPAYSPTVRTPDPWPRARPARTSPATPYGSYGPARYPSAPSPTAEAPSRRRRITGWLLVAALILALAVVGGLVWARSGGDAAGTGSGSGASTGGAPADGGISGADGSDGGQGEDSGRSGGQSAGSGDAASDSVAGGGVGSGAEGRDRAENGGNGSDSGGSRSEQPTQPQQITVVINAVRDSYSGSCPPPEAEAPYFTADLTVRNLPADVEYAWVTGSGASAYPSWQTLHFPVGGGRQRTLNHAETSHDPSGDRKDRISVKIRSPHQVASEQAQFSIGCEADPVSGSSSGYKSQSPDRLDGTTPTTSH